MRVRCVEPASGGHLAHASHRDAAECAQHVGLHTGGGLEHKDAAGTQKVHWHLEINTQTRSQLRPREARQEKLKE